MDHQAAEDIFICARPNHLNLSTTTFFRWRAKRHYAAMQIPSFDSSSKGQSRCETSSSDEVMATCMSYNRKSIISYY